MKTKKTDLAARFEKNRKLSEVKRQLVLAGCSPEMIDAALRKADEAPNRYYYPRTTPSAIRNKCKTVSITRTEDDCVTVRATAGKGPNIVREFSPENWIKRQK